jgi:uncharacterized protein
METFAEFLAGIDDPEHRARTEEVLRWVAAQYPDLVPRIGWNQPMFTDHGTFIISFSVTKQHLAASPEPTGINHFSSEILQAGYTHTKMMCRIPWNKPLDYGLLARMIEFNIADKAECTTFWRK